MRSQAFQRKFLVIIVLIAMVFSLISCAAPTAPSDGQTMPVSEDNIPAETMPESTSEPIPEPEPIPEGFTGDIKNYVYRYEDGRDREWEEDVLYLADRVLTFHPYMTEKSWIEDDKPHYSYDLYNPELRERFISEIDGLILRLSDLEEYEITYELQRILILINDGHTRMSSFGDTGTCLFFPFIFREFYEDGELTVYAVAVPTAESQLMYGKLTAINGIPMNEIITRLYAYNSGENDYWRNTSIVRWRLVDTDFLCVAGIMEYGDESAEFTFILDDGSEETVEIEAYPYSQNRGRIMTINTFENKRVLANLHDDLNYWNTYLPEDNIVYIRYNSCHERSDLRYSDFWTGIMQDIRNAEEPPKVVFDLRDNGGGYSRQSGFKNFIAGINNVEIEALYILVNAGTFSAGINAAAELRQNANKAVIVGSPAGQHPNILGPASPQILPNSKYTFDLSDRLIVWWKDYEEETLMPDILIHQTIDDYKEFTDTVLEAIKDM